MTTITLPVGTTTVLPATEEKAITDVYSVGEVKSFNQPEGAAFRAVLKRGKVMVANLIQHGDGGSTFIQFINRDEADAFADFAAQWTWTWGGAYKFPHSEESIVNTLVEEVLSKREMASPAKVFVKLANDPLSLVAYKARLPKGFPEIPAALKSQLAKGDKVWNKTQWLVVS